MTMASSRLERYVQLLQKGAAEFQRQIQDGLARKKEAVSQVKSSIQSKGRIASGLLQTAEQDYAFTQRVYRWIKSREQKFAFKTLREIERMVRFPPKVGSLQRMIELSEKEERHIKDLLGNLQSQINILGRAEKYSDRDFTKEYSRLVNEESSLLDRLLNGANEGQSFRKGLGRLLKSAQAKAAGIAAGVIALPQFAGADDLFDPHSPTGILNPGNPQSIFRPGTPNYILDPESPLSIINPSSPVNPRNVQDLPGGSGIGLFAVILLTITIPILVILLCSYAQEGRVIERLIKLFKKAQKQ